MAREAARVGQVELVPVSRDEVIRIELSEHQEGRVCGDRHGRRSCTILSVSSCLSADRCLKN